MEQEYQEEHLPLVAEGYRLPAILTQPVGRASRWAVVLLPGSMGSDVDGNYPEMHTNPHTYADLARQLAVQGHAVLRYARHGTGTGSIVVDEAQTRVQRNFPRQQYIAMAAVRKARELLPAVPHLAVAGHSEGSVHAALISQQRDLSIDALVSLSGPALRYMDLFIYKARMMAQEQGEIIDFGAFKVNAVHYIQCFELIRAGEPFTEEIKADPTMEFFVKYWDGDTPQVREGRQYMQDYDAIDPCVEIARVPCPVLVVQGGMDESGVHKDNGEMLYRARHRLHPQTTQMAFFPDLQHFYKQAHPGMSSQESMALDSETDPRVSQAISAWLDELRD